MIFLKTFLYNSSWFFKTVRKIDKSASYSCTVMKDPFNIYLKFLKLSCLHSLYSVCLNFFLGQIMRSEDIFIKITTIFTQSCCVLKIKYTVH